MCEHERIESEQAHVERPEGSFLLGIVGVCLDCDASLTLSGDEDEEGHPTWEADELLMIAAQSGMEVRRA